ncbi:hypothetical protein QRD02_12810 [Aequorivita sp. SDUM287046]|uniref:Intradiol ring-cleavage dioxygenases domain-containing protein n=1 Tax=Aequorivita aurantiaca TaxID=3053356 RepID=A0ABT8DK03_9FLAO|nr:hypothetical protein [Aequorivita aurantiaca]MDN3725262.1 hypothetical protein [Aequorivita aurantiaca]
MNKTTSRRIFMRKSALAISGLAVLTPTLSNAFVPQNPFMGYNPYAENKTDLRSGMFSENAIVVKGTIFNEDGTNTESNALVEVWHLSPNSEKYRHRAKLKTDENGNYEFITDFPNRETGKSARIYFKVSRSHRMNFTELVLNSSGPQITAEHWKQHNKLGSKLFPKQETFFNQTTIHFNISI